MLIISASGHTVFHGRSVRYAVGKNGITDHKQEGDLKTPTGLMGLRQVFYRPDRVEKPHTVLPVRALTPDDGWCDDVAASAYNQWIQKPFEPRHEDLWRADHIYDYIAVLGYNDHPCVPGKGSAIFMHLARESYEGTEGCIALNTNDFLYVLARITPETLVKVKL